MRTLTRMFVCLLVMTAIANSQWQTVGPEGGSVRALAVNNGYVFVGIENSLYRGPEGTANWTRVTANELAGAFISDIVAFQNKITVTAPYRGIYQSTDDGATWFQCQTPQSPMGYNKIAFDQSRMCVSTSGQGVLVSTDGGGTWVQKNAGLTDSSEYYIALVNGKMFATGNNSLFSYDDATEHWSSLTLPGQWINGLFGLGSKLFISVSTGMFVSVDNGITWTAVNGSLHHQCSGAVSVGGKAYAWGSWAMSTSTDGGDTWSDPRPFPNNGGFQAFAASATNLYAGSNAGVFESADDGSTWIEANQNIRSLRIAQVLSNGTAVYACSQDGGFFVSADNGDSWQSTIRPNVGGIQAALLDGNDIFVSGWGVSRTIDGGTSWIPSTLNAQVFVLTSDGTNILAGGQGVVYVSADRGANWNTLGTGLPANFGVWSLLKSGGVLYAGTRGGGLFKYDDGSSAWLSAGNGLQDPNVLALYSSGSKILAGTQMGLYQSLDQGQSWQNVAGFNPTTVMQVKEYGSRLYAATGSGVRFSINDGLTWLDYNQGLQNLYVPSVTINDNFIFAGTSGASVVRSSIPALMQVTFQVNMGVQIQSGNFNPSTMSVVVRGDFEHLMGLYDWQGNSLVLTKSPTDESLYTITAPLFASAANATVNYKFIIVSPTGDVWENGANRTYTISADANQTIPADYFSHQTVPSVTHNITFQADLSDLIAAGFDDATDSIEVRGNTPSLNWSPGLRLLKSLSDPSLYTRTVSINKAIGDTVFYTFHADPESKFTNNGWENGSQLLTFIDADVILPVRKPLIGVAGHLLAPTLALPVDGALGLSTTETLVWYPVAGAIMYHVQISTAPDFSSTVVDRDSVYGTGFITWGIALNTGYYWRVRVENFNGTSDWSLVRHFSTMANYPMYVPSDSFQVDVTLRPDINGIRGVVVGDTRGDGKIRIVAGSSSLGKLYIYSYDGTTYQEEWSGTLVSGAQIIPTAIGDVNNDGVPEIVVNIWDHPWYGPSDGRIHIYRWDGTTYAPVTDQLVNANNNYMPAAIEDIDGDGKNELVMVDQQVNVFKNVAGTGSYDKVWSTSYGMNGFNNSIQVATGDVDGDDRKEIVALPFVDPISPNPTDQKGMTIIGYNGSGYQIKAELSGFAHGLGGVAIADFDSDGKSEILTGVFNVAFTHHPMYIVKYSPSGYVSTPIGDSYDGTFQVQIGDVDGNGTKDGVIFRNGPGSYFVTYEAGQYKIATPPSQGSSVFGAVGDVDGDGKAEIIPANGGPDLGIISWRIPEPLNIPVLIAPANSSTGQSPSVMMAWSPVIGASSYHVQVSTDQSFSFLAADLGSIQNTFTSFPLSSSTTYYWRVSASSASGTSGWSQPWSFTTLTLTMPPAKTSWNFVRLFTNIMSPVGIHGIAVDPAGKVWIIPYLATDSIGHTPTRKIYVFFPDGTPAAFSPIRMITVGGVTDTLLGGSVGISTDPNGNILYVNAGKMYRIDYRTGQGLARVVPGGSVTNPALTAPAADQNGNVFVGRVYPGNAVQVFNANFDSVGTVLSSSNGYSRTLAVTSDGKHVFWPEFDSNRLTRFDSPTGVPGPYSNAGIFLNGLAIESMTWHPKTGYLWVSSGSEYNPPASPYPVLTWYGIDPADGAIMDTIGWQMSSGDIIARPRAIAFSPTGDTAYVGCFNINTNLVQMFTKTVTIPPTFPVPSLASPSNGATSQPTALTLQWNAVSGATGYTVQVASDAGFQNVVRTISPSAQTSASVTGLAVSSTYYWRVKATDGTLTSHWTVGWSFKTNSVLFPSTSSGWTYARTFVTKTAPLGVHGLAVDPEGKLWMQMYGQTDSILTSTGYVKTRAIYVYYADGQPASFSPIKIIAANGITDTLLTAPRGMSCDPNGNILYSANSAIYRIDYRTGQGLNRVVPTVYQTNVALTAPASDQAGNVYFGRIYPGNAIRILGPNFDSLTTIGSVSTGLSRTLAVSPDGKTVYWPEYDQNKVYRFVSPTGPSGAYSNEGVFLNSFAVESMTWQPKTGLLWMSSGSDANIPAPPYPILTWYGINPSNGNIVDTIGWFPVDRTLSGRPRAIAFSPTGDTAYVGCFNINSDFVQMFIKALPPPNSSILSTGSGPSCPLPEQPLPGTNPAALKITQAPLTVEAWIYPLQDQTAYETQLVSSYLNFQGDPQETYGLVASMINGQYTPGFAISSGTPGTTVKVYASDPLQKYRWTHVAGTYDGSAIRIYIDGVLKGAVPASITLGSNSETLRIGWQFSGAVDEVRIWNTLRSAEELQGARNQELVGTESGLVGYWRMNAASSSITPDLTANRNDLHIVPTGGLIHFNPWSTYGTPSLVVQPMSLDLGTTEVAAFVGRNLSITAGAASPVIGMIEAASWNMNTGTSVFFVEAGATKDVPVNIQVKQSGSQNGAIRVVANALPAVTVSVHANALPVARRFDANNIGMWVVRDGRFAFDPLYSPGLEWPKGSGKTAVYSAGVWIGAKVGGQVRTATAGYQPEFQAGPIVNGVPVDPTDSTYRVYKISAGDNAGNNPDFAHWPSQLGAPINADGSPQVIGTQTLFSVYNDMNPVKHSFGSAPLGAEVQQTTFGSNLAGARNNSVIVRFKIINKSTTTWNDTYVALWSDPDLGNPSDDLAGVDTSRNLGFVYNGSNDDNVYGAAPPSVGFDLLKGAFFTKPIQAFSYYMVPMLPQYTDPQNATQVYNFLSGHLRDGSSYVDSATMLPTAFAVNGDPVTHTGWTDRNPSDKRILLSSGPFTLESGQSKEIIAAIAIGQGGDNISSITALRGASDELQMLFNNGQLFGGALENVVTTTVPPDQPSTLNDVQNSGTELTMTGGSEGATVELASFVEAPPGAPPVTNQGLESLGNYLDVDIIGSIVWPMQIKMYYTANDLVQAGVFESEVQGISYWSTTANGWKLYSESGPDDQERGPSTTWVDTTNFVLGSVHYEGAVYADAYHLTPMVLSAKKKLAAERFLAILDYISKLPDNVFKKPASERRPTLMEKTSRSQAQSASGNTKGTVQSIQNDILNHLVPQGKSTNDLWVTDEVTRQTLITMYTELLVVLQRPQDGTQRFAAGSVEQSTVEIPTSYALYQNYPNPFNPITRIAFDLPKSSRVSLVIYNVLGQAVAHVVDASLAAGAYTYSFSADRLGAGIYYYVLTADDFRAVKKMVLLK